MFLRAYWHVDKISDPSCNFCPGHLGQPNGNSFLTDSQSIVKQYCIQAVGASEKDSGYLSWS